MQDNCSEMIAVILSVILILWILYKLLEDKFTPLRKIPKAQGSLPVFGHMFIFLRTKNELKLLEDWSEKHGGIFRYSRGFGKYVGPRRFCFILFAFFCFSHKGL